MFNSSITKSELRECITKFENEFKQIIMFQEEEKTPTLSSTTTTTAAVPTTVHYHFTNNDNSWKWLSSTYVDNKQTNNIITTSTNNDNKDTKRTKEEEEEEQEKKKQEEKSQVGNHPILFLFGTSVLAFSSTYLIATDGYIMMTKRLNSIDRLIEIMDDKFRETIYDNYFREIKKNYNYLKEQIIAYYKPTYHSKLGLIGSGLLGLTYLWPFGHLALTGSIFGLTGFGCYWLWHKLTDESDYRSGIIENIKCVNSNIDRLKNTLIESEGNDISNTNPGTYIQYQEVYPKVPTLEELLTENKIPYEFNK